MALNPDYQGPHEAMHIRDRIGEDMLLPEVLTSFGSKVGASLLFKWSVMGWNHLKEFMPGKNLRKYKVDLELRIRSMPFIYKDLELNAVEDFVDVELVSVDTRTLQPQKIAEAVIEQRGFNTGKWWRFTQGANVVLIGEPGIGKTTIFRHLVLSILSNDERAEIFPAHEKLVPIFVPLKAIDANAASPILRHITQSNPVFSGEKGRRLLMALARRRRLILFLDGYDEIPHAGGVGLVSAEISLLLGAFPVRRPEGVLPEFMELCDELRRCRVLLSTRREFYAAFRPKLDPNTRHIASRGVYSNRQVLVSKIFSRYRKNSPTAYGESLHEELFLQRLAQKANKAISEISYNPLFLTALCFTYATQILHGKDPEETWRGGTYELISECIKLLVVDIDKNKVRGLPEAQRLALMNRRASYPDAKFGFLRHLAGRAYEDRIAVFSMEWMTAVARDYFSRGIGSSSENADILAGFRTSDPTANVVAQLVYSGVFASYELGVKGAAYDFPHRRFREVLAVDYFNNPEGAAKLCERCAESELSALLLYFVQHTGYWEKVCNALARVAAAEGSISSVAEVFAECLESAPSREAACHVVRTGIDALALSVGRPNAGLS